ncbi:LysM peptidoglycan-binding domain-containing protein [Gordonia sp. X0973]|nr:LysM peptidoglycan-binding domain-containing protein [Gordonia sp. X0973]
MIARRRGSAAAILVGAALAGLVWLFAIVGGNYEASTAPDPVATSVVHVRGGETLNSVAARVAPDMPRQAVINQLRALNGLPSSQLTAGQALVAPVYR